MRKSLFYITSGILFSLPFIFNSCQNQIGKSSSSSLDNSEFPSSCQLRKLAVTGKPLPQTRINSPFANGKVQLGEWSASLPSKANSAEELQGALVIRISQSCTALAPSGTLSRKILLGRKPDPEFDDLMVRYQLSRNADLTELIEQAQADPCILSVSRSRLYQTSGTVTFNDTYAPNMVQFIPIQGDAGFNEFYHSNYGLPTQPGPGLVTIAILDTGVDYQHPDLIEHAWSSGSKRGFDSTITVSNDPNRFAPLDVSPIGHGTHVAGLAAAAGNNSRGVVGAMPFRATIMPVKVFAAVTTPLGVNLVSYSEDVVNGIRWAVANGANVINMSLNWEYNGILVQDEALLEAIQEATSKGVVVVGAIGNSTSTSGGSRIDGSNVISLPGIYGPEVRGFMVVGSIDAQKSSTGQYVRSISTHYSPDFVEISAPGFYKDDLTSTSKVGIYSTTPNNAYTYIGGTSMAAPLVSGAAALTYAILRQAFHMNPPASLIEDFIVKSATKDVSLSTQFKEGSRMDLKKLIDKIHGVYPETAGSTSPPTDCL